MAKFGMKKSSIHDRADSEQVDHKHVPGRAYEITSPVTKLIHVIGGGYFNEPRYYDSNRSPAEFYTELLTTGKIASTIVDDQGLTKQAREVLETATAVANSDSPEDLLVVAAWARDPQSGLKLRTTPQVLLAFAAAHPRTRPFVPAYGLQIMRRADEIRQVFGIFRHLFMTADPATHSRPHRGSLPHALRKALAHALATQSSYALLKYNDSNRPTFSDVLKMVGGSREIGKYLEKVTGEIRPNWPIQQGLFQYLVDGTYSHKVPRILAARREVFSSDRIQDLSPELIRDAGLTWENVVSHFGNSTPVWELCIPLMGEMALARNLRNFEEAEISEAAWDQVIARMLAIEKTVQLPIQIFAAAQAVSSDRAKELTANLLDKAVANLEDLPGITLVLSDNSGSARRCSISRQSSLHVSDCGNMLAAILSKKLGERALVGVFGDSLIWIPYAEGSTLSIKARIDSIAGQEERSQHGALAIPEFATGPGVGEGTETGLWWALDDVTRRRIHVDRIIFLSDLCCYTQGDQGTAQNCGYNMETYFGRKATMQSMVDRYRQTVNEDCRIYSVNLSGYVQSQLRPRDKRTHLLSGSSEQLLDIIKGLEDGSHDLPTIEVLRTRYQKPERRNVSSLSADQRFE